MEQRGARVIEVRLTTEVGKRIAFAVIRAPELLTSEIVARLNEKINGATGRDISLHVRTILIEEMTRDGPLFVSDPTTEAARGHGREFRDHLLGVR